MAKPLMPIDEVEKLASIGATMREMALWFNCTENTISERLTEPDYQKAYNRARATYRISIRRKQTELAMAGNVTMLIWLGKQELGQRDRIESEVSLNGTIEVTPHETLARRIDSILDRCRASPLPEVIDVTGSHPDVDSVARLLGEASATETRQ